MKQWYKITTLNSDQYTKAYALALRLGLNPSKETGIHSFIIVGTPKHLTRLRLEFADIAVYTYTSMSEAVKEMAEYRQVIRFLKERNTSINN